MSPGRPAWADALRSLSVIFLLPSPSYSATSPLASTRSPPQSFATRRRPSPMRFPPDHFLRHPPLPHHGLDLRDHVLARLSHDLTLLMPEPRPMERQQRPERGQLALGEGRG